MWAGAMLALYAGVIAFITLLFNYINYTFPDPLGYLSDPYQSGIPYQMASLIVLAPVFLILMRVIRKNIERDPSRAEVWVRRWALFLTVFVAGATIVIDLIVLLTAFLSGEALTAAFLLKVLTVFLVVGAGFLHFLADLRGYWQRKPAYARYVNWAVGVLVAVTILSGFVIVGTPGDARLARLDQRKVNDLQSIQSQITYYYQQKQALPPTLSALEDPLSYYQLPVDPETGEAYGYRTLGALSFELCATFNRESTAVYGSAPYEHGLSQNWQHAAGEECFERTIDPEFYPSTTVPKPVLR